MLALEVVGHIVINQLIPLLENIMRLMDPILVSSTICVHRN